MDTPDLDWWQAALEDLCVSLRVAVRQAVLEASQRGGLHDLGRSTREGAGDTTFVLDECAELAVDRWFESVARSRALSLLTEDSGWRHRGPDGRGAWRELSTFDHGGPRIALDPIDGTRNAMADLRSAWSVVSCAGPGPDMPRLSQLVLGIVAEIPDSRARCYRVLSARSQGACQLVQRELDSEHTLFRRTLCVDDDSRPDHGYFPFFRYAPALRPALGALERGFFERLQVHEGADTSRCYDDQYICNAGQLVLLALGTYRTIFDLRGTVSRALGLPQTTSKPYDVAGAILCARRAGCIVEAPPSRAGPTALDFPLDCSTPVDFIGWVNPGTRARLLPHLAATMGATGWH